MKYFWRIFLSCVCVNVNVNCCWHTLELFLKINTTSEKCFAYIIMAASSNTYRELQLLFKTREREKKIAQTWANLPFWSSIHILWCLLNFIINLFMFLIFSLLSLVLKISKTTQSLTKVIFLCWVLSKGQ